MIKCIEVKLAKQKATTQSFKQNCLRTLLFAFVTLSIAMVSVSMTFADNVTTTSINSPKNTMMTADGKLIPFNDVLSTHWAYENICKLAGLGAVTPDQNYDFRPDEKITRVDFTVMMVKALGLEGNTNTSVFNDMAGFEAAIPYINRAYEEGLANGVGNGKFNPSATITRQDATKLLAEAVSKFYDKTYDLKETSFTDASSISSYAKKPVEVAGSLGLVKGYSDGTFKPKNQITRAETASIVTKLNELVQGVELEMPRVAVVTYGPWKMQLETKEIKVCDGKTRRIFSIMPEMILILLPLTGNELYSDWFELRDGEYVELYDGFADEMTTKKALELGLIKFEYGNRTENGYMVRFCENQSYRLGPDLYMYEERCMYIDGVEVKPE